MAPGTGSLMSQRTQLGFIGTDSAVLSYIILRFALLPEGISNWRGQRGSSRVFGSCVDILHLIVRAVRGARSAEFCGENRSQRPIPKALLFLETCPNQNMKHHLIVVHITVLIIEYCRPADGGMQLNLTVDPDLRGSKEERSFSFLKMPGATVKRGQSLEGKTTNRILH